MEKQDLEIYRDVQINLGVPVAETTRRETWSSNMFMVSI